MDISDLTNEERETHLLQSADDRKRWVLFSEDPVMIRRAEKLFGPGTPKGVGFEWELTSANVRIRRTPKPRKLSDARRAKMAQQLAQVRAQT